MLTNKRTEAGKACQDGQDQTRSAIDQQIDENLKRIYQQVLEEDIPEHLRQLLDRLREQEVR